MAVGKKNHKYLIKFVEVSQTSEKIKNQYKTLIFTFNKKDTRKTFIYFVVVALSGFGLQVCRLRISASIHVTSVEHEQM